MVTDFQTFCDDMVLEYSFPGVIEDNLDNVADRYQHHKGSLKTLADVLITQANKLLNQSREAGNENPELRSELSAMIKKALRNFAKNNFPSIEGNATY